MIMYRLALPKGKNTGLAAAGWDRNLPDAPILTVPIFTGVAIFCRDYLKSSAFGFLIPPDVNLIPCHHCWD